MPRVFDPYMQRLSIALQQNQIAPMSLINDNFHGYLESWLYTNDITWMEKTVATPYWTGMMLFSIDSRGGQRKKHNMLQQVY